MGHISAKLSAAIEAAVATEVDEGLAYCFKQGKFMVMDAIDDKRDLAVFFTSECGELEAKADLADLIISSHADFGDEWDGALDRLISKLGRLQAEIASTDEAVLESKRDMLRTIAAAVYQAGGEIRIGQTAAIVAADMMLTSHTDPATGALVLRVARKEGRA